MKNRSFYIILIILGSAAWGLIGLFSIPLMNNGYSSIQVTFLRSIVLLKCLICYGIFFDRNIFKVDMKDLWLFSCSGIISIVMFNVAYFVSMQLNQLSVAVILLYTGPFFVVIFSWRLFKEKMSVNKTVSIVFCLVGCSFSAGLFKGTMSVNILGILVGICSGLGYGLYSIFSRIALRKYKSTTVIVYTFAFASLSLFPFVDIPFIAENLLSSPSDISLVIGLGVISTLIPFLLYTKGLEKVETGIAAILTFFEPFVASAIGIAIFREGLTLHKILGMIIILIALIILNLQRSQL